MLGRAAKLRQRNAFETEELMLEIPWGPVLRHGYTFADMFSKQWVWWVPLAHLRQAVQSRSPYLRVFAQGYQDTR